MEATIDQPATFSRQPRGNGDRQVGQKGVGLGAAEGRCAVDEGEEHPGEVDEEALVAVQRGAEAFRQRHRGPDHDQPGRDHREQIQEDRIEPAGAHRDFAGHQGPLRLVQPVVLDVVVLVDDVGRGVEQTGAGRAEQDRPDDAPGPDPRFAGQNVGVGGRAPGRQGAGDHPQQGRQQRERAGETDVGR